MKQCRHAKAYKAIRPPTCNDGKGNPCAVCAAKWARRTAAPPDITSDFAILDVKVGRAALVKLIEGRQMKIPAIITGYINCVHSHDDGVSIEFSLDVRSVKLLAATARKLFPHEEANNIKHIDTAKRDALLAGHFHSG